MRTEAIRVKKSGWVRIVNPDPIQILGMSWRYGCHVRVEPGGVFQPICGIPPRTLAMYRPPHAPSSQDDAPPDALVLYTPRELHLLAEGRLSFNEPYDAPMPRRAKGAPEDPVHIGDRAGVPLSRMVRAAETLVRDEDGAYRGGPRLDYRSGRLETFAIRPGGIMRAIGLPEEVPGKLVKVHYQANTEYRGEQCPSGHWFDIPEAEFVRMKTLAEQLREAEDLELAVVISLLRSF